MMSFCLFVEMKEIRSITHIFDVWCWSLQILKQTYSFFTFFGWVSVFIHKNAVSNRETLYKLSILVLKMYWSWNSYLSFKLFILSHFGWHHFWSYAIIESYKICSSYRHITSLSMYWLQRWNLFLFQCTCFCIW